MPHIERILCPIDFSEFSVPAYDYALSLARHYQAGLFVQHVVELWKYPSADYASAEQFGEFCRKLLSDGSKQLEEFVKTHARSEVQPQCVVQQGGLAPDFILAFAEKHKIDLIVMGTHGRRGFDRWALGSVTERVLRKARRPVLAVHRPAHCVATSEKPAGPIPLRRILCCIDFSNCSARALEYAVSAVKEYNAELIVLHVIEDIPNSRDPGKTIEHAQVRLAKSVPAETYQQCRIKSLVRSGKPYEQIILVASEAEIDLVIMGVRGRNALDLALFGSTTYRVIQLGPCPVLAVHV